MKRAFLLISSAVLFFGLALSCTEPAGPEKEDSIEFSSETTVTVPVDGLTTSIAFKASSAWTAKLSEGADAFAIMSPTSGAAGDAGITLQVRKNNGGEERRFSVTVTSGKATGAVSFVQAAAATASTSVETIEADGDGGEYELPVTLNVPATITTEDNWITVGETKALETVTYLVKVAANPSTTETRKGTVTVTPQGLEDIVVEVEQKVFVPVLKFVGEIPKIPQEGGTVEIPFETNMDVDIFAGGIEGVEATIEDGKVVITAPANPSIMSLNLYVALTAKDYEGEGTSIAINVYQLGMATIEWSVPMVEHGLNINIAYYSICPMAVDTGQVLVSDGSDVYVFDAKDGAFVKTVKPVLGDGGAPQTLANDNAGNIIMAGKYADGTENCKVWKTADIDTEPTELLSFTNNLGGVIGNFRVHGDVTGSAVISTAASASMKWGAWQITAGALDGEMVSGVQGAQKSVGDPYFSVCEPIGDKIADGFFYGSYNARPNIWYCSNPASNTWANILATAQDWDTNMNSMDVVVIGSKTYLLYLTTGFFTYSNVHFGIVNVTDPSNPEPIATFGAPFYSGAEATSCYGGGGIVGVLSSDGTTLEVYVCEGSRDTLAKISILVSSL